VNGDDDDESRNDRSDTKPSHEEYGDPEGELDDEDAEVYPGEQGSPEKGLMDVVAFKSIVHR
jgi:hypothetical protein